MLHVSGEKIFLFPSDYFNLLLYDFFSCCLPANKAGIEFYYLIAVLCQYSCGIFASLAASAVHGDSLAFGKSGSGQLGIEALSRGAARCVFLDENREAVNIVMKNCKNCGVFDRSRVNIGEAARFLSACREQFDLVLLDPPFHNGTLENILPIVDKCVAPGGIVICESETKLVLPAEVGGLQLKKQYKYGKVLLWKYVRPMADAAEEEGEA